MIARKKISTFVSEIARQFKPQRVVLFGSYAYGRPGPDSDVDLLVIMPHRGHPAIKAVEICSRIRAGFPLDLIVRSPAEIRRRLAMEDCFIAEVLERGQTLYEGSRARMG